MATSLQDVLVCPISLQLFQDPVVAEDGHTYEREAITEWIRLNGTSPLTRQPLNIEALRPNFTLKQVIDQFEIKIQEKKFKFKLNIDVRREKRALFQTFGKTIYKAEWIDRQQPCPSIIILKIDGARANKEASFYVDLSRHPHIVRTYGLVEDSVPNTSSVMLLQEYASEGSLLELLNDQTEVPAIEILEEMFIQIADAMIFLAYNGVVHGDLACRNVLIFRFDPIEPKKNLVKLTDFGLSRFSKIYSSVIGSVSTTTIHVVPTRTAAPEILINNCADTYSEKSDIFSMGMLMIEALNKGAMPWAHVTDDNEVRRLVIAGNRPQRPQTSNCTDKIWKIISNCLAQSSAERPTFKELREKLTESKSQCSKYPSININAYNGHPNAATAPNSSFHENYQPQPNAPIYSPPQYSINSEHGPLSFPNDFFNSIYSALHRGTDLRNDTNTSNNNSNHFHHAQSNGQNGTEVRNVDSYHTIKANGTFAITLTTDGPEAVTLTSDQPKLLNFVTTIVESGILTLKMVNSGTVSAHISGAHRLANLIVSGHSSVETRNALIADRFQLISSGSSSFNGSFKVQQLDLQSSGCSKVSFNGSADTIMLSVSGSSSCHAMEIATKRGEVRASGNSYVSLKGSVDTVLLMVSGNSSCHAMEIATKRAEVRVSGNSNVSLKGSADTVLLSVSGNSSCKALQLEAKTAQVTATGSSNASIYCTETLEVDTRGTSSVQYKGNAKVLSGSPKKIS